MFQNQMDVRVYSSVTWKRRVEQVPLMEPARKAFTMGLIPAAISRPDMVGLRIIR